MLTPEEAETLYRILTEAEVRAFAEGVDLSDFTALPARLTVLEAGEEASLAEVTLTEGKFHEVKRMFAAVGHPLEALQRLRIGCVPLTSLPANGSI